MSPHAVMPWPPRTQPMACGFSRLDLGDVQAQLETGPAPRHPDHLVAEDLAGQLLTVGGGGDGDAGVGMQMINMGGVDQAVHRGVDRRRRAALAVQAVVERGDHLVLALDARIDVDQGAHPVQPQHGQPGLLQRAEVATGALDPEQLDRLTGDRIGLGALGGGVAAGVVGVLRIGAEPVAPADEIGHCWLVMTSSGSIRALRSCRVQEDSTRRKHAPHPACWPPSFG